MSSIEQQNNKRIAKNTLLLYFRMLFLTCIGLYTSRVILKHLGVVDFGIYNVVGGVVSMFNLISSSLSTSISRFITFELGRQNSDSLKKVFSSSVTIQFFLAAVIVAIAEPVGLWFLNEKMVIPEARMAAANWVFQFSIVTFCMQLISVPYNAAIVAHEKMSAFAYISIVDAVLKLAVAFLITVSPVDKLVFYAAFLCGISCLMRLIYGAYCSRHFAECKYKISMWDKTLLKQMFSFAGWNFIGCSAGVLKDYGGNILLNLFFGPVVNAARSIALQVSNHIQAFVQNFMIALNPQITKSYAKGDYDYMMKLIFAGARFSFYLLLLLSLPVMLNCRFLLNLWLTQVPDHTVLFVELILVYVMSESISNPLITAQAATGNIRNYQIVVGGVQLLNIPVSYALLKKGLFPEIVVVVTIALSQISLFLRLYFLKSMIKLKWKAFLKRVYFNVLLVSVFALIAPLIASRFLDDGVVTFIVVSVLAVICSVFSILFIGCNSSERHTLLAKTKEILQNRFGLFLRKGSVQ